mgnify:CR=1 FL=1
MRRKQLPQINQQSCLPNHLKTLVSEFLTWFTTTIRATKPFVPFVDEALAHANIRRLNNIDIAVGAGIDAVKPYLATDIEVVNLSLETFDPNLEGAYSFFNCFHTLTPEDATRYLTQLAQAGKPVIVAEGNNDNWWQAVGMTVFVPLTVLLASPFVTPFRWTRLVFTYLLPVLPVIIVADGVIALFKLYNPDDLNELTAQIDVPNYTWTAGKADNGRGGKIMYLLGG